jgi:hypothetical protein
MTDEELETKAWNCDMWPDWLIERIEAAMEVSDRFDMSTEQVLAYAILSVTEERGQ